MQVGIDVKCMHTNFSERGFLQFGRYCYLQKRPKFPFGPWIIVHGRQKIEVIGIDLKKFVQIGIDVQCMHTNFSGHDFSGFGDIATFKNGQISLSDRGL